jgi:hypothetical protein
MQNPNVILSGGGMKGAYQYGFFKRVYELKPDFKINRIYSVSVGSLNAIPILVNKMHILDKHWDHPTLLPFDTIVNDWESVTSTNIYYRNLQRARAFIKHGSIYNSLNIEACASIIENLDADEFKEVQKRLIIISFDSINNKMVFDRCWSRKSTVTSIKHSSLFPGLFSMDSDIIDGMNVNIDQIIKKNTGAPWLCLDLQGDMKSMLPCWSGKDIAIFSPDVVKYPTKNVISCLIVNREILDEMIFEGKKDAEIYLNVSD